MGGASSKPPESHPQPRPLKSRFRCPTAKCLRSIQTNRRKTKLLIPTLSPVPDTVLPESSRSQDMIVLSCQLFRLKFLELSLTPLSLTAHIVSVSTSCQHILSTLVFKTDPESGHIPPPAPPAHLSSSPSPRCLSISPPDLCSGSLPPSALQSIPLTATAGGLEHRNQMRPPVGSEPANVLSAHVKSKALARLQDPTRLSPYFPASPLVPCRSIRPIALQLLLPWPLCHSLKTFPLPKCLTSRHPHGS